MQTKRIAIQHVERGFVDVEIDNEMTQADIEALVEQAFDNGDAIIVTSTLSVVDTQK